MGSQRCILRIQLSRSPDPKSARLLPIFKRSHLIPYIVYPTSSRSALSAHIPLCPCVPLHSDGSREIRDGDGTGQAGAFGSSSMKNAPLDDDGGKVGEKSEREKNQHNSQHVSRGGPNTKKIRIEVPEAGRNKIDT